MPGLTAM